MQELFQKWDNKNRYYTVYLHKDLFGAWMLERSWGGKQNRIGGGKTIICSSYNDGLEKIKKLYKIKQIHNYNIR